MMTKRISGILLHPTSLPSHWGIGDLGPGARTFIDFLHNSGQHIWQMLPLGPTGYGDSPYQSLSAFAGNTMLVSPTILLEFGLLQEKDIDRQTFPDDHVDYGAVISHKRDLLKKAHQTFISSNPSVIVAQYRRFCSSQAHWLDDYALFAALKEFHQNRPWVEWPVELVQRDPEALSAWSEQLEQEIEEHRFAQFLFFDQWAGLHRYANSRGVRIIGDIPIFVAHDSCDVWSHQEWFLLDKKGEPTVVAGVPPDYFSETGQRWGNPLFDWPQLKKDNYSFWVKRFRLLADMYDFIRIDHFRGFAGYWEIPAEEEVAVNGCWKKGPGSELFRVLEEELGGEVPIIAEDLGLITDDVIELLDELGYPGMAVLQFGFGAVEDGASSSTFLPHNHHPNQVVYTGTHDNDTTLGWWREQSEEVRDFTRRYLNCDGRVIHRDMIRAALSSTAKIAIFPLQDLLGLGNEARMNRPSSSSGNWQWRFSWESISPDRIEDLKQMTRLYGRIEPQLDKDRAKAHQYQVDSVKNQSNKTIA
ncbi:MAG: 4-alpha-glucanotransferase [Thermodesulfobacteriota bacterium]